MNLKFLMLLFVVGVALALPRPPVHRRVSQYRAVNRLRRAPLAAAARHRTMLISGYYRPLFAQRRQGYEPETAMTAFAAGDNVAAGSYLGTKLNNCASCAEQDNTEFLAPEDAIPADEPIQPQAELPQEIPAYYPEAQIPIADAPLVDAPEAEAPPAALEPVKSQKRKPAKKVQAEDDEADDDLPLIGRGKSPYGALFPVIIGGYPGSARSGAGGGAGGVTAIANAYSTGKGGVATSHATAYGGGAPARGGKRAQPAVPADDADDE